MRLTTKSAKVFLSSLVVSFVAISPPGLAESPPPTAACHSIWREVELSCDERAIRAEFGLNAREPLVVCDLIHDRATRQILAATRQHPADDNDPLVREYLHGALWNDDPAGLLDPRSDDLTWCRHFRAAQTRARQGHVAGPRDALLDRSHFGDLQALHGLATRAGESAHTTYERIIAWIELSYRVGTGEIRGDTRLGDAPVTGLRTLFPDTQETVAGLLHAGPADNVQARALGSLLHVLQDLVGAGHSASHAVPDRLTPLVDHYFTYAQAHHPLHACDTGWRTVSDSGASLDGVAGLPAAIQRGIDVLRLAQRHEPWPNVKLFLDRFFFEYTDLKAPAQRLRGGADCPGQ